MIGYMAAFVEALLKNAVQKNGAIAHALAVLRGILAYAAAMLSYGPVVLGEIVSETIGSMEGGMQRRLFLASFILLYAVSPKEVELIPLALFAATAYIDMKKTRIATPIVAAAAYPFLGPTAVITALTIKVGELLGLLVKRR